MKDVTQIPTNQLEPNPLQPRGVISPDSVSELIESIREHGILEPLIVAQTPAGYQIIAGERRWRAVTSTQTSLRTSNYQKDQSSANAGDGYCRKRSTQRS